MDALRRIHIVVLSHDRPDRLPALFRELLLPAVRGGAALTVVDNGSGTEVRDILRAMNTVPGVEIVLLEGNRGVAGGRNEGFRRVSREFAVCLDDDAGMELDALAAVPHEFDRHPDAGILAFRVVHGVTGALQTAHALPASPVGNFHGAGHAVRASVLERAGLLDERCVFGAEEIEYSMRVRRLHLTTVYVPEVRVLHYSLTRPGREAMRRRWLWLRNYAMVLFRYLPAPTAGLFSLRLLVVHVALGFGAIGPGAVLLPAAVVSGAARGLRTRSLLPPEGATFYRNPRTRPDLGNVSLRERARVLIRNRTARSRQTAEAPCESSR